MNFDVAPWIKDWQHCCHGKVTTQLATPVQPIEVPAKRFSHVHLNLNGSVYLLIMINKLTIWLEAAPLRSMEATVCADAFISTRVTRYSVPAIVTTDSGRQFTSAV